MTRAHLRLDYLSAAELATRPGGWWHEVLGVVGFATPPAVDGRVPVTASMTPSLDEADNRCEVWQVSGAEGLRNVLSNGDPRRGRVHYRYCEEFLFGSVTLEEQALEVGAQAPEHDALSLATMAAYRQIFEVLKHTSHRHLIRVWNYLPEINRETHGNERYRRFNSARQAAFKTSGRATEITVPAACALGSPAGSPLSIYFLASRQPATMIENPRQISAYHYPPQYGVHSPSFSRACVLRD
jgi:chorismate lyase / 3-hydroxybenzoate synthase